MYFSRRAPTVYFHAEVSRFLSTVTKSEVITV